jgi:hypothetical protein
MIVLFVIVLCYLVIFKKTVFTAVVCHRKREIVCVRFTHYRTCPIVEPVADVNCLSVWRIDVAQKLGQDLSRCINPVVLEFDNRSWPHTRNFFHLKFEQTFVDKFDDSVGAQRTFTWLILLRHFVFVLTMCIIIIYFKMCYRYRIFGMGGRKEIQKTIVTDISLQSSCRRNHQLLGIFQSCSILHM